MMNNVIPFPSRKIQPVIDEFDEEAYRDLGDDLLTDLLTELYQYSPEHDLNEYHIDLCFLYEALISFIFRLHGRDHIMQHAADAFIELMDEDDYDEMQLELDFD